VSALFVQAGWRTRPALWADPGCVPGVLIRTIPGMITGRDRDPAGTARRMPEKMWHSWRAQQAGRRPCPLQSEVDSRTSRYPRPRQPPHHRTAVPTGAPIGWARVSASVLILQRACSARTQVWQAAFASSPASSRLAVIWPWPSPRPRPGCEVLAQSNHFRHWDRLAPEWLIWAPHVTPAPDGPEAPIRQLA